MTKIHFQNLRSKNFGNFFGQKIEILKFSFFKLTFRRKIFEKKNRSKNIFRPIFFLENFSSKSQFKKWKFQNFDFLSEKISKIFRSQILKMDFRHEKLIFFIQIFFSYKVSSYYIAKQHRRWAYLAYCKNGTGKRPRTLVFCQVVILFRERLHMPP